MPRLAASEIEPMIATGIAMSSGHGVATTSTARKRTGSPLHHPGRHGEAHGKRRVDGAELVAQTAQLRAALLGLAHHS